MERRRDVSVCIYQSLPPSGWDCVSYVTITSIQQFVSSDRRVCIERFSYSAVASRNMCIETLQSEPPLTMQRPPAKKSTASSLSDSTSPRGRARVASGTVHGGRGVPCHGVYKACAYGNHNNASVSATLTNQAGLAADCTCVTRETNRCCVSSRTEIPHTYQGVRAAGYQ
eukprot:scaffold5732_cov369-Prasinococcus_capsulatus_cf.AAC.2